MLDNDPRNRYKQVDTNAPAKTLKQLIAEDGNFDATVNVVIDKYMNDTAKVTNLLDFILKCTDGSWTKTNIIRGGRVGDSMKKIIDAVTQKAHLQLVEAAQNVAPPPAPPPEPLDIEEELRKNNLPRFRFKGTVLMGAPAESPAPPE